MMLDNSRPIITPASHETHVEHMDLSDSEDADSEEFKAFTHSGTHNKFGNSRFKFKLCPQYG